MKEKKAHELLKHFDLAGLAKRFPETLSGGERQRIATIRALTNSPKIILADEPASSMDDENTVLLMELLKKNQSRAKHNHPTDNNRPLRKATHKKRLHVKGRTPA